MIREIDKNTFINSKGDKRYLFKLKSEDLEQMSLRELFSFIERGKRAINSLSTRYSHKLYFIGNEIYLDTPIISTDFNFLSPEIFLDALVPVCGKKNVYSDPIFKDDYCKVNGRYIRFINLTFEEDHTLDIAGLQDHGDYFISFKRIKTMFSKNLVNSARKMNHTALYSALADIEGIEVYRENEEMLRSIITREQELFQTEISFIVKSDSESELVKKTDELIESLEVEGFSPRISTNSLNTDFKNFIFGMEPIHKRPLLFHSSMLFNSLPIHKDKLMSEGAWFHSRNGNQLAIDTRSGDSYSALVTGKTGNGKTFFVNKLISTELEKGRKVFIIDPKRDYRKHALSEDAYIIDSYINPMMFKNKASLHHMIMSKIPRVGNIELLSGKILKIIRNHKLHLLNDFFKALEVLESEGLEDISYYFEDLRENITTSDLDLSNFTYVEMSSFSKNALPFILSFAFEYVRKLKDSYSLIVDEAHRVFKHNPVFLEERAREMRSQNSSLIPITQSYQDLLSNEFGRIVADSCFHKIFFSQSITESASINDFDLEQINSLETIKGEYSEFYYKSDKHKKVLRYYPTDYELELFKSDLKETDMMLDYINTHKAHFTVKECVNQWIGGKYVH